MFAITTSRIAGAAVAVLMLAGAPAYAQQGAEVSSLKVTGKAPTSIKLNVTGLQRPAVRHLVRIAAAQVCDNAVHNRELASLDGEWCVGATLDRTMGRYDRIHAARARQVASGPETFILAVQ